ncbi:hypothetical protein PMAYCL1PPCAC_33099, partial [Pristionchus mayeri]
VVRPECSAMALPLDKLSRALRQLQQAISSNPHTGTLSRKPPDQNGRINTEIQRVKATFLSTDLSSSESRSVVTKIMHLLIGFLHHSDESLRTLAYESFLALSRHLILIGQDTRLLLIVISELAEQPQARPAAGLVATLAKILRHTKPKRLELFSNHIFTALVELLHRPEEAVHLALIANLPALFKTMGPVVHKLALAKKDTALPFEQGSHALKLLNSVLSKCLDVRGSANRSAVITVLQLAAHSPLCLQRALAFCTSTLSTLDDEGNPTRLTASINVLRGLFEIVMADEQLRETTDVRRLVCLLLCFTHSAVNEVLIASFECLAVVFPLLTREQLAFYPPDVILSPEGPSTTDDVAPPSSNNSPFLTRRLFQQKESLQSSPSSLNSSLVDIPFRVAPPSEFDQLSIITIDSSMNGGEGAASPSNSWDSRETEGEENSEIIDPLMHAELYEEQLSMRVEEETAPTSPSSSSAVLQALPDIFRSDPRKPSIFLPEYTLFLIAYRFLLQEDAQGLISDQKVRVSHKMLALALTTLCAAKTSKVLTIGAPLGRKHQNLHALTAFIYHADDKLAAAAVNFIATAQSAAGENAEEKECRDWFGFVWSRLSGKNLAPTRRALLQAITGRQRMLERIDLVGKAITLATTSKHINFGHLKTAMASFLCSLDWSRLSSSLRSTHQMPTLDCLIDLLGEKDPHVVAAVAKELPLFVERADFGTRTDHFMLSLPDSLLAAFPDVPIVVALPETISLSSRSHQRSVASTLLIVIRRLLERLSNYRDAALSDPMALDQLPGLISALSSLATAFPPSLYHNPWSAVSMHSHGLVSLLVDVADGSALSSAFLAKILRVQAAVMGGRYSNLMADIVGDKRSAKEREAFPPLGDSVLYEKLFIMPMRVLNLYYCIAEDRRLELSGRHSLAMGTRPKELRGTERISSYSRLVNAGITPTKSTAFNDCASLLAIVPQLRGAFHNYLDSVDGEHEAKMVELLEAAVHLLSTLLEMTGLHAVRPLVPEIAVYIDALSPFSPFAITRLSTQVFKSIFGRNTQNVNLGHLKSIRVYRGEEIKSDNDVADFLFSTEFQSYRNRVSQRPTVDNYYLEHFGWLGSPSTVLSPPATSEVNTALRYFETFITKVVGMYGNTTDVETKKTMLNLFIQLRLSGIEFELVDPAKKVVGAVEEQLGHLVYPEMIREVFSFLIILARHGSLKWSVLKLHALALCNAIEGSKWKMQILDGLEVFLHEFLLLRKETPFEVTSLLFSPPFASILLVHCPAKYLQLYHMYLHTRENNEESYRATASNLFKQLSTTFSRPRLSTIWHDQSGSAALLSSLFLVVSSVPPSALLPIDEFVGLLKSVLLHPKMGTDDEQSRAPDTLVAMCPLLFMIFSDLIEEERFIHRTESHFEKDPVARAGWLFRPLARAFKFALESMKDDRPEELVNESGAVFRAASTILRIIAVSNRPVLLENFIICAHEEGLLAPSLLTLSDRLTPEWLGVLARFKENDRVAHLFIDALLITQDRVNHRYLSRLSLQLFVRFVVQHRYPGSTTLIELKERVLLMEGSQLAVMRAMKQSVEIEEEFVKSIPAEIGQRFIDLALKTTDESHLKSEKSALIGDFVQLYERTHGKGSISIARPTRRRRHCRLADNPSELLVADSSFELIVSSLSRCARFPSLMVPAILEMNEGEMSALCTHVYGKADFPQFIATVLSTAVRLITRAGADPSSLARLQLATSTFLKCVINVERISADDLMTLFANVNPLIILRVETSILDEYVEQPQRIVQIATKRLKERNRVDETCSALQFFLQHPTTTQTFTQNPMAHLHVIHSFLLPLLDIVESRSGMEYPSRERAEIFSVFGVDIQSNENDQLFDLFHMSQFLLSLFSRGLLPSSDPLGLCLRSLLRLPIVNAFALTPKTALDGGWQPSLELVANSISVPLPPIHKLNDVDILDDFTWRCLFLGWTSRQQFESVWVSLVGVLSSTPSGDELKNEMALDAVLVSSLAIRRLCSFLLLTQLEPQPGNPIGGRFRLPSREISTTFCDSENYSRLCHLLGELTNDPQPETILKRSIEWSIGSKRNRQVFHLDQFGVSDLWAHVGLVNDKAPVVPAPLRVTTTAFLDQLRIELDAASAVRSLYENFSHWFSRGIDVMPMELLSETLRAMCVLCDLFEDATSFESMDLDMRALSSCSYLGQADELGLALLAHSKAVAVIGQEELTEDQWRRMQSLIATDLDHRRSGVRCSTIRGVLFLLQSSTAETLNDLVKYLVDWTIRELDRGTSQMTDLVFNNGDHTSIEYRSLLWSLAFRLIEHPSRVHAKSRLFQIVIDVFLSSSPSTMWQMEALTMGMQELVVHSQTFAAPVMRTAMNCLDKFASLPARLPFALHLLAIAVHREPALFGEFASASLPSLMETSRMCETPELTAIVRTAVALRSLSEHPLEILRWLSSLIFTPSARPHPQPAPLIAALHALTRGIRETRVEAGLLDLSRDLLASSQSRQRAVVLSLTLAACSPFTQFVHLYDSLRLFHSSTSQDAWELFLQHYRDIISV